MPALRKEPPGDIALPVYLGNALQWDLTQTAGKGEQPDFLASDEMLEIFVPAIDVTEPQPQRLPPAVLCFPISVAADAQLFDRILNNMIRFGERSESPANFAAWMDRELAQWLEKVEALWERQKRSPISLLEQWDYYGKLSCQFPTAAVRVVYTKAGTHLAACAIRESSTIIDHKLYWAAGDSMEEARYLCGILNSEALRSGVEQYQSQGQWGARDFDKYVFNLPIPRFDADNPLHGELAQAAKTAKAIATAVQVKEAEHFTRVRARIRSALAEHGVAAQLERLVGEVFKAE